MENGVAIKVNAFPNKMAAFILIVLPIATSIIFVLTRTYHEKIDIPLVAVRPNQIPIYAPKSGVITYAHTKAGAIIAPSEELLSLTKTNPITPSAATNSLKTQIEQAKANLAAMSILAKEQLHLLKQQEEDLDKERAIVHSNLNSLTQRREKLAKRLDQHKLLAQQGYYSTNALLSIEMEYESSLIDIRNTEHQLQTIRQKTLEIRRQSKQLAQNLAQLEYDSERTKENLSRELAENKDQETYSIKVGERPVRVEQLIFRNGDTVNEGQLLAVTRTLEDDQLVFEAYADSRSIGGITLHNEVTIRLNAFPFEEFGYLTGTITSISTLPIHKNATKLSNPGAGNYFYAIRINPKKDNPSFKAPLAYIHGGLEGQTSIKIKELTILEWLFLPIKRSLSTNPQFFKKNAAN